MTEGHGHHTGGPRAFESHRGPRHRYARQFVGHVEFPCGPIAYDHPPTPVDASHRLQCCIRDRSEDDLINRGSGILYLRHWRALHMPKRAKPWHSVGGVDSVCCLLLWMTRFSRSLKILAVAAAAFPWPLSPPCHEQYRTRLGQHTIRFAIGHYHASIGVPTYREPCR